VYHQLLQAGVEKQESEKVAKMKETLANLQRLFPGTFSVFPPASSGLIYLLSFQA
jgi:hypothetical protein